MVCTKHTVQTRKSYKGFKDVTKDISSESVYVTLKTRIALAPLSSWVFEVIVMWLQATYKERSLVRGYLLCRMHW